VSALAGRAALVTGAGRGIGRAVALALASRGMGLTLAARSTVELDAARRACLAAGAASCVVAPTNLTDRLQVERLARRAGSEADVLVNNAGTARSAPLERTNDELWDGTFALNVYAPFALCRAAVPRMAERGFGRVVNVASTAALEGYAYTAAYCASKHALLGLTRALSAELARRSPDADVTLNAVCPGFVDTAIVAESAARIARATGTDVEAAKAELGRMNPGGRLLTPDEVAARIVALAEEWPGTTRGQAVTLGP